MKKYWKWIVAVLVLALLATSVLRLVANRRAAQQAAQVAAPKAAPVVELGPGDVVTARVRELTLGLPISGSVKAANVAVVKARVAGELQGLNLREGDTVAAGQVVARIDPTEYRARDLQARQQADAARAQLTIAQRQFDNNRALVDQGFISRTALETSQANLDAAQANLRAAQAAAEVTAKALADAVLTAPLAGLVSQRFAQSGERVGVDARIVEIVDPRRMELEASLPPEDAARVRTGQQATLDVDGLAQPLQATVVRMNPATQAGTRGVLAYLSLPAEPLLRQGLFGQGTLALGTKSALAVPLDAVRTDKPEPYVQTIAAGRVAHTPVRVLERGLSEGRRYAAVEGVPDDAQVLAGSVGALRAGTEVRVTGPAAPATAPGVAAPAASASAGATSGMGR